MHAAAASHFPASSFPPPPHSHPDPILPTPTPSSPSPHPLLTLTHPPSAGVARARLTSAEGTPSGSAPSVASPAIRAARTPSPPTLE